MKKKAAHKSPTFLKRFMTRVVVYGMAAVMIASGVNAAAYRHSDQYMFDRVVQIKSEMGSCSGEQVEAPSGKKYILTAGHCRPLVEGGSGKVITEDGQEHPAIMIAEDANSDLLLLEGIQEIGALKVATDASHRDSDRTYTHGAGLKAYRTDGVLIDDRRVTIMLNLAMTPEAVTSCLSMPKQQIVMVYGVIPVCVMSVEETFSTAFTAPGSSGGAVVDAKGALVGVVSAGGGGYSLFVRLSDIRQFLSDK